MPASNVTHVITKIVLRNDIKEKWEVSKLILEKGEPAIEIDLNTSKSRIKIGDGSHTFSELPYATLTPDDIQEMINNSMVSGGAVNSVALSSGTKKGTLKLTVNNIDYDNIEVTGLGSAAYTDSSEYATAAQGARASIAMVYKGSVKSLPTNNVEIGDTYSAAANFTITVDESETGEVVEVVVGDVITVRSSGKWFVMPTGVADTAKSLTEGISANITGGVTGKAEAANAGETMNIEVTEVNTDYLKQGSKVIILHGGNASS